MDKYLITLPILDLESHSIPTNNGNLIIVEKNSEKRLREEVEKFAYYFKWEFNYDNIQYLANKHKSYSEECIGLLFCEWATDKVKDEDHVPYRLYGGGSLINTGTEFTLNWIWLHPFFRHRGHLKDNWRFLKKQYGDFSVMPPLSADMEKFLSKSENLNS